MAIAGRAFPAHVRREEFGDRLIEGRLAFFYRPRLDLVGLRVLAVRERGTGLGVRRKASARVTSPYWPNVRNRVFWSTFEW